MGPVQPYLGPCNRCWHAYTRLNSPIPVTKASNYKADSVASLTIALPARFIACLALDLVAAPKVDSEA